MAKSLCAAPCQGYSPGGKRTLHFTVPFPPSVNGLFANRSSRTAIGGRKPKGRKITPAYLAWRDDAGYRLNLQRLTPLPGPVAVTIIIPDQGRCDIDNLNKAILDLAVAHKLIDGDGRKTVRSLYTVWAPRADVLVTMVRTVA